MNLFKYEFSNEISRLKLHFHFFRKQSTVYLKMHFIERTKIANSYTTTKSFRLFLHLNEIMRFWKI